MQNKRSYLRENIRLLLPDDGVDVPLPINSSFSVIRNKRFYFTRKDSTTTSR